MRGAPAQAPDCGAQNGAPPFGYKRQSSKSRTAPDLRPAPCFQPPWKRKSVIRQFVFEALAEATRGLYGESPDFGASTTTIEPILTRL
jgi:hypothetical protein